MAAALAMLLVAAPGGLSQTAGSSLGIQEPPQQAPAQPAEPPPAASPRQENPGLVQEIGKLFDKLPSVLPPLKSPSETVDDLNARAKSAAKDAGEAMSRMTKPSSMVSGRIMCPVAANGTSDCNSGADRLCQSKGFKQGRSLNTDSVQSCSPKVFIPGRQRKPDDCRTDNFVTAALCQ